MSNSCVFCPSAKNKNTGEIVPSRLFMGLLEYSSNDRKFAKENYVVATNEEFIDSYSDRLKFDDNDEVTVGSYLKVAEGEAAKEKRIKQLNKQLGSGTYDYAEADARRQTFENQADEDVNEDYTTVMIPQDNGKVKIEVGENSSTNRDITLETIKNKVLFDKIKNAIKALGGDITFIDEKFSKYSTENAEKLTNGLYAIIQLAKGGNITTDLAHEAGHFAVGALGKENPLIQRLENNLTNEVLQELLGKEYEVARYSKNPQREAMGILVGKYIANEVDAKSTISRLVDRVVNSAKRLFYKASGDIVSIMKLEAKETAEQIASNFLSQKNAGSIDNALDVQETLFNVQDDAATVIFKDVIKNLTLLSKQVGAFDKTYQKELNKIITDVVDGKLYGGQADPAIQSALSAAGILDAVDQMLQVMPTLQSMMDAVSYDMESLTQSATNLRTASIFVRQLNSLDSLINALLNDSSVSGIDQYKIPLRKLQLDLQKATKIVDTSCRNKSKKLFLSFLKEAYGKDYIKRAARMVFKEGKVVKKDEETIEINERLLEKTNHEGDWLERFSSMSNSSDIINQIVYKAAQAYTNQANINTMKCLEDLRELRTFCDENNVNTENLFERDSNNNITGNYITELNWGNWEAEYMQLKKDIKAQFESDPIRANMIGTVKSVKLAEFASSQIKAWHKQHSYFNTETGRYEPLGFQKPNHPNAGLYYNSEYNNLSDTEKKAVSRFLEIKKEHDNLLTQTTRRQTEAFAVFVSPVRMPQFRGRAVDETNTIIKEEGKSRYKAFTSVLRKRLIGAFTHQANDTDYGNDNTRGTLHDDIFGVDYLEDESDIRRVATYGINKFSNINELTHDLFAGMLQYSAMANTYNTHYQMSNALEVGSEVLLDRQVKGTYSDRDRKKGQSLIFKRFEDFLNSQIYNLYNNSTHDKYMGKLIAVDKTIGTLNSAMSQLYLAGNIGGAMVNTGTGTVEIFKEAFSGSHFNMKDALYADKLFVKYAGSFWIKQMGKEDKTDKMSLFLQQFDAGNRFEEKVRGYSTKASRAYNLNPFGHNAMVLYSTGDFYMQAISYLAMANKVKIKLKDGSTTNLWEAMTVVPKDPNNPNSSLVLRFRDDVVEEGEFGDVETYTVAGKKVRGTVLNSVPIGYKAVSENDVYTKTDASGNVKFYTDKQVNGNTVTTEVTPNDSNPRVIKLSSGKIFIPNEGMHTQILEDGSEIPFEVDSEGMSAYKDKCREINNRMHGIYNRMDKTMFHSSLIGKFVTTMKGYVFGSIARKFMSDRYLTTLGRDVEGEWSTMCKLLMSAFLGVEGVSGITVKDRIKATSAAMLLPVGKHQEQVIRKLGFSVEQYRNMKRNWFTNMFILVTSAITYFTAKLAGLGDDDDDDKLSEEDKKALRQRYKEAGYSTEQINFLLGDYKSAIIASYKSNLRHQGYPEETIKLLAEAYKNSLEGNKAKNVLLGIFGYYFSGRLTAEQAAYTIFGANLERKSVLDLTPLGFNALTESVTLISDLISQDEVKKGSYKGQKKWVKDIVSKTPYLRSWPLFADPYEAYDNWEFGRKMGR